MKASSFPKRQVPCLEISALPRGFLYPAPALFASSWNGGFIFTPFTERHVEICYERPAVSHKLSLIDSRRIENSLPRSRCPHSSRLNKNRPGYLPRIVQPLRRWETKAAAAPASVVLLHVGSHMTISCLSTTLSQHDTTEISILIRRRFGPALSRRG